MNDSRSLATPSIDTQAFKQFEHRGWVDVAPQYENVTLVWRVATADALLDGFLETGVRTRGILLGQTHEALAAIREAVRVASRPYERDGMLQLPTPCVIASARKSRA